MTRTDQGVSEVAAETADHASAQDATSENGTNATAVGGGGSPVVAPDVATRPPPESDAVPVAPRIAESTARPDYRLRGIDVGSGRPEVPKARSTPLNAPRRRRLRRLTVTWLLIVGAAVLVAVVLRLTVVEPYTVSSDAMTPTLQVGDKALVVTWSMLEGGVGRGDILLVRTPDVLACRGSGDEIPLRVIGLPGETIWSAKGSIYVDGRPLHETAWYDTRSGALNGVPVHLTRIAPGHYFVMGDNRSSVCDSRIFGPVAGSSVVGKVVAIEYRGGHPALHFF